MKLYNQSELGQAVKVLVALEQGDDFNRGVVGLGEMLRVEDRSEWSLVSSDRLIAAARSLLALDIGDDFDRGVLALAGALLPSDDLAQLQGEAGKLRGMMGDVNPAAGDVAALDAGDVDQADDQVVGSVFGQEREWRSVPVTDDDEVVEL